MKALYQKQLLLHKNTLIHSDLKLKDCFIKKKKNSFIPQDVRPNVCLWSYHVQVWTTITELVMMDRDC